MILAPCPVGFWRTSALIRQILVLLCTVLWLLPARSAGGFLWMSLHTNVPTVPYPSC